MNDAKANDDLKFASGIPEKLFRFDGEASGDFPGWAAGIDEAGRGPLAGPVIAAAVIFIRRQPLPYLNDSKRVTPKRRESLFLEIAKCSLIGIGIVGEEDIDRMNIYQATRLAMKKAVLGLSVTPGLLLVDGTMNLDLPIPQKAVVRGDSLSASIAAASIIAKVYRDACMCDADGRHPGYDFKRHKGYGTRAHLQALKRLGPSPIHRKSFYPVKAILSGCLS